MSGTEGYWGFSFLVEPLCSPPGCDSTECVSCHHSPSRRVCSWQKLRNTSEYRADSDTRVTPPADLELCELLTDSMERTTRYRKPIVGLAGGLGAGKSVVAKMLGEVGAGVIDSDALSRIELNSPEVKDILRSWWGDEVFAPTGLVDRKKVAAIVFRDPAQRHRLEALLHPRVAIRRADIMAEFEKQPRIKIVVLDSPLLYETDLDLICDAVVFVDARLELRKQRSEKTRRWSEEEITRREKAQQPLDMKQARADYICSNNSTLAALRNQVESIFALIVSGAGTG